MSDLLLEMKEISKSFQGVKVLEKVGVLSGESSPFNLARNIVSCQTIIHFGGLFCDYGYNKVY